MQELGLTLISLSNNKPVLVLDLDFKGSKSIQRQKVLFPTNPVQRESAVVKGFTSHPQVIFIG